MCKKKDISVIIGHTYFLPFQSVILISETVGQNPSGMLLGVWALSHHTSYEDQMDEKSDHLTSGLDINISYLNPLGRFFYTSYSVLPTLSREQCHGV